MSRSSAPTSLVKRKATKPKSIQAKKGDEGPLLTGEKALAPGVPDFANASPQTMLQMQRLVGNRAASQVIQPKSAHTPGCGCPACAGGVQRKTELPSAHGAGCGCAACAGEQTLQREVLDEAHAAGCGCAHCSPAKSIQRTMANAVVSSAAIQRLHHTAPAIQRHGSAEHMLLGEVKPSELAQVAKGKLPTETRIHVLEQELRRVCAWHTRGVQAIKESDGAEWGVKMVKLGKNKPIWVTYGELNAMPDYVANPTVLMQDSGEYLGQFIQHIRYDSYRWLTEQVGRIIEEERASIRPERYETIVMGDTVSQIPIYSEKDRKRLAELDNLENRQATTTTTDPAEKNLNKAKVAGQVPGAGILPGAVETMGLDNKSVNQGANKYTNLLGRNACHFVPFSWERWSQFHEEARADARAAHQNRNDPNKKAELLNTARIKNGYADHFLQDSFAAGHLINKTLIMQWYVEWMDTKMASVAQDYLKLKAHGRGQAAEEYSQWGKQTQADWSQGAENSSQWGKQTQADWDKGAEKSSQWGKQTQADWDKGAEKSSQWGKDVQKEWDGWGYLGAGKMIGWGARALGGTMWGMKQAVGGGARALGGTAWGTKQVVGGGARALGGTAWGTKEAIGGGARALGGTMWGANKALQGGLYGASYVGWPFMPGEWEQIRQMDTKSQPGLAGKHLYAGPTRVRKPGESADPQTAEEAATPAARKQKAGVQGGAQEYQNYLTFLKKGCVQIVTGKLHDKFCKEGLIVANKVGNHFKVFGDYNLLNTGDNVAKGVEMAATAAQLSQQAIEDLANGKETVNVATIFDYFPKRVLHPDGKAEYTLEQWHDGTTPGRLKDYATKEIFEPTWQWWWNNLGKAMDMDKISQDYQNPHPEQGF